MSEYRDIPTLLHDSKLLGIDWDSSLESVRLLFGCLRRNLDGSSLDEPVELLLEGVEQIGAYYDPPHIEVRPSEFLVVGLIRESELSNWKRQPCEASLFVNSHHADFLMAVSCVRTWFAGVSPFEARVAGGLPLRIHLAFNDHSYARESVAKHLFIGCDSIRVMSSGIPLSMEDWRQEFDAWWQGWKQHWTNKETEVVNTEQLSKEDTFIPAGESDHIDLSYRPPSKPAFQLSKTDAPNDLLAPLCKYHVGLIERHWETIAAVYPNLDQSDDDRAEELKHRFLTHEFGRWVYLRHVDKWWIEGQRACVVVRGIEHTMPDDEDPARNEETVLSYQLFKREERWIISTWSQGWPRYGSAPALDDQSASWKTEWKLTN